MYRPSVIHRACALCGTSDARPMGTITAGQVVKGNDTYRADALATLGLEPPSAFTFAACGGCGFVYATELPDPEFLRALYEDVIDPERAGFESQSPAWVAHQLTLASLLVERFGDAPTVRLLDFGCGYGTIVCAFRGPRVFCKGYEPARSIAKALEAAALDAVSSLAEVEKDAPYDGIILSDVLEHVPEPRQILATCHALLKEGGWLVINVPDFGERRMQAVFEDLRSGRPTTRELNPWEHLNYFSPESLSRVVQASGFHAAAAPSANFGFRLGERGLRAWLNAAKSALRMADFVRRPRAMTTTLLARRTT